MLVQYKMIKRHNLKHGDYETFPFYQCFLHQCQNRRFLANFVIGGEAGFALNGTVNNHIVRMYTPANQPPDFNYNVNDSRQKLTVGWDYMEPVMFFLVTLFRVGFFIRSLPLELI